MILYNSNYFGVLQLTIFSGSAVYRTILPSLVSTGAFYAYKYTFGTGLSAEQINEEGAEEALYTVHPFVIAIYIMAFSLIINHRLNYCYQRYWESCSNIFMMTSKWMDSATTLAAFHYQSAVYEEDRPRSFGDEDKPMDQWKEKDKNKSAPTGGNTRTAMVNPDGFNPMDYYESNGENLDGTAASDTSDSIASFVSPSSLASAARETSMESHGSFFSSSSRHRIRRHSEEENYNRTKQRFSSTSFTTQLSFRQILRWKRLGKRKYQSKSDLSDPNESFNDSSLFNTDMAGNTSENTQSKTPPRNNLSGRGNCRDQFNKSPSMPTFSSLAKGSSKLSLRRHGAHRTTNERPADKHDRTEGTSGGNQGRHRRVPSSDIPTPGVRGPVVKSFKPNPSLAWQRKNRTAMPSNTGLHSTVFHSPIDFDFEKLLLEEEKERKEARHQRQLQRPGAVRRRSSFPNLKKSVIARALSNTNSEIGENSPERIASDPARSISTISKSINSNDSLADSMKRSTLPIFLPRLELHDLPSLHEIPSVQASQGSRPSIKKAKVKRRAESILAPVSPISTFSAGYEQQNIWDGRNGRQPSSFRPPAGKMNGRASLFLQEAAHLFSLMSAVAMASLRADMEGISSPLVDYVPGQKFPPVNPEEMQIKVLVTKEHSKDPASDDRSASSKIAPPNDKTESELRVKIMRNSTWANVFMFLFGTSRNSRQRTIYNASRPFSVLGGVSDAEVAMLRKVRGPSAQHALCCLWLREFITREHLHGSTGKVAPPIVARVYQHISDGTQQYNNCRKTAFTDFPFPHAQLTSFFTIVSIFIFPLLYYTYVNDTAVAVILNFFSVGCFIGIQEVALELEQPFIRYPNDLPLNNYQAQFNEALISSLYGGFHPDVWGDTTDNAGVFSTCTSYEDGGNDDKSGGENQRSTATEISSPLGASLGATGNTTGRSPYEQGRVGSERSSALYNIIKNIEPNRDGGRNAVSQFRVPQYYDNL